MPRRYRPERRKVAPDPRYNSEVLAKFINNVMRRGKKSLAMRIVYQAMDIIAERTGRPPLEVFEEALQNAMPLVEVRPKRVGGATYQVPMEIRAERRQALGMRWLIENARRRPVGQGSRLRGTHTMAVKLANELMDTARGEGATIRRKEEMHRMAEANRAFAHFR